MMQKEGFILRYKYANMFIKAPSSLREEAYKALIKGYGKIEEYGVRRPAFLHALTPIPFDEDAPPLIKRMLDASSTFGVGPMASVAGALSLYVGERLLRYCDDVIVENGGDIFICKGERSTISVFAPTAALKRVKIGLEAGRWGICTSSGTVGHSLSFGKADAVTVLSTCPVFADAAATALANKIIEEKDVEEVLSEYANTPYMEGLLLLKGGKMGVWGKIRLLL